VTPIHMAEVHALEQRAFNAWPAPRTVLHGDWVFRLAGGFTKRANSANAALPGAGFGGVRQAAEALYARHGLPTIFRMSPLATPEADEELAGAGYLRFDPTVVASASLDGAAADRSVRIDAEPTPGWLAGFAAANQVAARDHALHHAIVRAIALPAAFATLGMDGAGGQPIGFGLAVLERGAVGCYDIVIDPAHRRRGHALRLMRALMHWAREQGAHACYLQVREQNAAARHLYARLGFEDRYPYHYRLPPP